MAEANGRAQDASDPDDVPPRSPVDPNLPRAASYTYFPPVKESILDDASIAGIKGTISEDDLADSASRNTSTESFTTCESSSDTAPSPPSEAVKDAATGPPSSRNKRHSVPKFFLSSPKEGPSVKKNFSKPLSQQTQSSRAETENRSSSPARSLTRLRHKSWKSISQPSSPAKSVQSSKPDTSEKSPTKSKVVEPARKSEATSSSDTKRKDADGKTSAADTSKTPPGSRRNSILGRRGNRPLSALIRGTPVDPNEAPVPKIPKSFSTDRLPSFAVSPPSQQDQAPPMPAPIATEKLKPRLELPRKKDELWNVFRTLDGDFQK
jgi:hypothetical protein